MRLLARVDRNNEDVKQALHGIDLVYGRFYVEHQRQLGHYLRNLFALLEFVADSGIENLGLYSNVVGQSYLQVKCLFFSILV